MRCAHSVVTPAAPLITCQCMLLTPHVKMELRGCGWPDQVHALLCRWALSIQQVLQRHWQAPCKLAPPGHSACKAMVRCGDTSSFSGPHAAADDRVSRMNAAGTAPFFQSVGLWQMMGLSSVWCSVLMRGSLSSTQASLLIAQQTPHK